MRCVMAFLGLAAGVVAPAAPMAEEPPTLLDVAMASSSVYRGIDLTGAASRVQFSGGGVGWRAALRATGPLARDEPSEWRLAAHTGLDLRDNLTISVGGVFSRWSRNAGRGPHESLEMALAAEWRLAGEMVVAGLLARDTERLATTSELTLARGFPLTRWGTYLDARLVAGWTDGGRWWIRANGSAVRDAYGYWAAQFEVPYRVGIHTSVVAGAGYAAAWNHAEAGVLPGRKPPEGLSACLGVRFDF